MACCFQGPTAGSRWSWDPQVLSTAEAVIPLCFEESIFSPPWDNETRGLRAQLPVADIQALSPTHCISLGKVSPGGHVVRPMPRSGAWVPLGHTPLALDALSEAPCALRFLSCAGHITMTSRVCHGSRKGPFPGYLSMRNPLLDLIAFVLHYSGRCSGQILLILIFEMRSLSLREVKSGQSWAARKRKGMTRTPVLRLLVPCTSPLLSAYLAFFVLGIYLPCLSLLASIPIPRTGSNPQKLLIPSSASNLQQRTNLARQSPEVIATLNTRGRAEDTGLKLLLMAKNPFKEIINDATSRI